MIPGPNPDHEFAARFPDIFDRFRNKAEKLNKEMETELQIVSSLIVGAWLGVLLVTCFADNHIPAFTKSSVTMLFISLTFFGYRKWRWYYEIKRYNKELDTSISIREIEEKHGPLDQW